MHEKRGQGAAWVGKGVGAAMCEDTRRRLLAQGSPLHALMLSHASYEPVPDAGWHDPNDYATTVDSTPMQPTVYTDGSARPPRPAWAPSAAVGLYWPHQHTNKANADWIAYGRADELHGSVIEYSTPGCTGRCAIRTARQSSTRVEAIGLLVAAAHLGSHCIAADNNGAVRRWNAITHMLREGR